MQSDIQLLSHAVLLSGGSYESRRVKLFEWFMQLFPELKETSLPYHPDMLILPKNNWDGLENEEGIKIDDVRSVIQHLQKTAHQGGNKIAVLLKADTLPIAACNALLKVLEEPPSSSYLFLLSEYPHLLPATLKSRCQKFSLPSEKKISPDLVEKLTTTLSDIKKNKISVFQAGEKWQKMDILEVLDGLFYFCLNYKSREKKFFYWYDLLNHTRRQILNKQNPNHLLVLENIFYQWKMFS